MLSQMDYVVEIYPCVGICRFYMVMYVDLRHVYFGDVCFISAATFEEFDIRMLFGIC